MQIRSILTAALACAAVAAASAPAAAIQASPRSGARPKLDVRSGTRTPVPGAVRGARHALVERLGIEAHLATDPVGGGVRVLNRTDGYLSGPHAGDAADVALAWVRDHAGVFGLTSAQIAALRLTGRATSRDGVTHLTWVPESHGIPAYDGELRVHVTRDGRVLAASGPPLGGLAIASATPGLTASQALAAAQDDVGAAGGIPRADTQAGPEQRTTFADGASARLVAFQAPGGDRLAWRVAVAGKDPYWFDEVIDAGTGAVLARRSLTDFAVSNAEVYDYYPGAPRATADGGTAKTVDISRWLNVSATTLTGPNAHAYADVNNNDRADSGEEVGPSSGTDWTYPITFFTSVCAFCTWDDSNVATESTNRAAAATQLFYFVNTFHDWLRDQVGFTTAAGGTSGGNFEGADPVLAEADDSSQVPVTSPPQANGPFFDNANMTTFPDGTSPRMQMYLFGQGWPAVNGADDASVVYHEYTHGLSNRLIDDANGLGESQGEAMGEGWSDWYAMDYLVANGFVGDDPSRDGDVRVGEYVTGNRQGGIRWQPLDCSVGSTAANCPGTATSHGPGGFTYADLGRVGYYVGPPITPRFEVHDDGEIWSETLWDLRKALGAPTARTLITDAMRLSPAEPSFLDERDAILLADENDFGRANHHDAIWQVFANRGMGYGARTSSPNATRAIASFTTPGLAATAPATISDAAPGGDGDGVVEPGETVELTVPLVNPGLVGLTGVQATLTTATAGVAVPRPVVSYGTIAAGATAAGSGTFQLAVPRSFSCGNQVSLTLHVTSDQGSIALPVLVSSGSGRTTFTSTDVPKAIPDAAPTSTSAVSTLSVPSSGRIDRLRVTMNVTHTWVGDLRARLTAPSGQTIDLLDRPGISGTGSSGLQWNGAVTFDDSAGTSIQELPDGPGTLSGSFAPDEPLAVLAGQDRLGTWRLQVTDGAAQDVGTLNGWSIETDQPACVTFAIARTGAASDVTQTTANLHGTLDPGGTTVQVAFQYGKSAAYGQQAALPGTASPSATADYAVPLSALAPGTTYHYRMVALSGGATVAAGADATFTTAPAASSSLTGGKKRTTIVRPTRRARLNRRDRFAYAFRTTPLLHGRIRFTIPRHGRVRAISFGGRRLRVSRTGRVRVVTRVRGRALRELRRRHRVRVTVTIVLGRERFVRRLVLIAPRPRHRSRR